jgi:predicted amidohydrolase YtcJ
MASPSADVHATAAPAIAKPKRGPREKFTFMLHHPETLAADGKFVAPGFREAALKAASGGKTKIMLRKSNTRQIREFEGAVVQLDQPKQVSRGERVVTYYKKPTAKFVKSYTVDEAEASLKAVAPPAVDE